MSMPTPHRSSRPSLSNHRAGTTVVLIAVVLTILMASVAFSVDVGYMNLARTQLQATADSASLAGAAALYPVTNTLQSEYYYLPPDPNSARLEAQEFTRMNFGAGKFLDVNMNLANDPQGDIVIGRYYVPSNLSEPLDWKSDTPNTVRVRVPLSAGHVNGPLWLFFARVLGYDQVEVSASGAATVQYPSVLPFVAFVEKWETISSGGDGDDYAYIPGGGSLGVTPSPDGIPEINIQPGPWDGYEVPPGNFGRIDIGPSGETMKNFRRQVDMGPSISELDFHGGRLEGGMEISGETGLKSSAKISFLGGRADARDFAGMLGQPRQLPLYNKATGRGSNALFTIDRFVAVRVMAIKIDGRIRTNRYDTEGSNIDEIIVQPITELNDLINVYLTR